MSRRQLSATVEARHVSHLPRKWFANFSLTQDSSPLVTSISSTLSLSFLSFCHSSFHSLRFCSSPSRARSDAGHDKRTSPFLIGRPSQLGSTHQDAHKYPASRSRLITHHSPTQYATLAVIPPRHNHPTWRMTHDAVEWPLAYLLLMDTRGSSCPGSADDIGRR